MRFVSCTLISVQYLEEGHSNHYSLRKGDTVPGGRAACMIDFILTFCLITLSKKINLEIFSSAQKSKTIHFVIIFKFLCMLL